MKFCFKKVFLALLLIGISCLTFSDVIQVKTRSPLNKQASYPFRIPKSYNPQRLESYRVLVMFGGRNTDGLDDASGRMGWAEWADENEVFLVCPGLKDDNYWEPEVWSGRALLQALAELKKTYNICTSKLLFYGYSAGSQASNLYPAWRPELTRAWVSHACGVFHEPSPKMRGIPGLVTCGDADTARYVISRNFVENARKKGIDVIWKSFPNHPHDVPPDSLKLARAFLTYYHELHRDDLSAKSTGKSEKMAIAFVGDDQEHKYYPATSAQAKNVMQEDRVILPNQPLAEAWGISAE